VADTFIWGEAPRRVGCGAGVFPSPRDRSEEGLCPLPEIFLEFLISPDPRQELCPWTPLGLRPQTTCIFKFSLE